MYREVTGAEAMGYLATKPTVIITTLHESGVVNGGVFGAYTNLSGTQIGVAIGTQSHTYANILRTREFVINVPGAELVKTIRVFASAVEFAFEREVPIGYHSLMVGRVRGGWIKRETLDSDGKIDIFKARVFKDFKYPRPLYVLPGEVIEG